MPNTAKKNGFPLASDPAFEADMDDFDLASLDDLATMMVDALTLPLPADFRDVNSSDADRPDPLAPHSPKQLN